MKQKLCNVAATTAALVSMFFTTAALGQENCETCNAPTDISASGVTSTGASINWTGDAASYEVYLSNQNQAPGQGVAGMLVLTNSWQATSLSGGTSYYVYVRSMCEPGCSSNWVAANVFCTPPSIASPVETCYGTTFAGLGLGSGLNWYASADGGTAINTNTTVVSGTYYVSHESGDCESDRTEVSVVANLTTPPITQNQSLCGGSTVADLTASGFNVQWYASSSGGSALSPDMVLSTGTYYASQTYNSCESARRTVEVTITSQPAAPTASAQNFCGMATVSSLTATGSDLKWYTSENGGVALSQNASLTTGTYYVSQTAGCESERTAVEVTVGSETTYYADEDGDGYGNIDIFVSACTAPEGYVALPGDCDDSDGNIFEGCEQANMTQIREEDCGSTVLSFNSHVFADRIIEATAYRFRVNNGSTTEIIEVANNYFKLNQLSSYNYTTAYTVDVSAMVDGEWSDYGTTCVINTPEAPLANIKPETCGSTLSSFSDYMYSNVVPLAQLYRFRTVSSTGITYVLERPVNYFKLNQLPIHTYGTSYAVEVSVMVNGAWGPYGDVCVVNSPDQPQVTSIRAEDCGATFTNRRAAVYADRLQSIATYRFRITSGAGTQIIDRPVNYFKFNMLSGITAGETISVEVMTISTNGIPSDYGSACSVTLSASAGREGAIASAKTYPNPFVEGFTVQMDTESTETVNVSVFDMNGRPVDNFTAQPTELETKQFGSNYGSGYYNIVVTQGTEQKVLHVVKK
jgi:hypothetical protein